MQLFLFNSKFQLQHNKIGGSSSKVFLRSINFHKGYVLFASPVASSLWDWAIVSISGQSALQLLIID